MNVRRRSRAKYDEKTATTKIEPDLVSGSFPMFGKGEVVSNDL